MLSKSFRLPVQTTLGKGGRSMKTPYFLMKIFLNSLPHARVGAIISSRVSKKAVVRNKVRRLIFSTFSREFLNGHPGKDILIIANPKILELETAELRNQLIKLV